MVDALFICILFLGVLLYANYSEEIVNYVVTGFIVVYVVFCAARLAGYL